VPSAATFVDGATSAGPTFQYWLVCEAAPTTTSGTGSNLAASLFSAVQDCQYAVSGGGSQITSSAGISPLSNITQKQAPGPAYVRAGLTADAITNVTLHDKYLVKFDIFEDYANSTRYWAVSNALQIEAPTYTLTLDPNGGTLGNTSSLTQATFNAFITLPSAGQAAAPTRNGYQLVGWNTLPSDTYGSTSIRPSSNSTVYAIWAQPYTVTLDANGGTPGTTTSVTQLNPNSPVVLPTAGQAPTRTGYVFNGWGTSPNSVSTVNASFYMPTGNVTLYAVWSQQGGGTPTTSYTSFTPSVFEITDSNGGAAPAFTPNSSTAEYKIRVSGYGATSIKNLNISIRNSANNYFVLPGASNQASATTWDPATNNCGFSSIKIAGVSQTSSSGITCAKASASSSTMQYFATVAFTSVVTGEIELTVAAGTFVTPASVTDYSYRLNLFSQVTNYAGFRALLTYGASVVTPPITTPTAEVVRLPEWQSKAITSITKVIDQSGVKLLGGKIKLDGFTASDLKKVTLNGKEISIESLNPSAPVLNIPAGSGTGDLVFTLADGGTWTFQNAIRYVEPLKAGKPMKLFNFDAGSTTVNSYQVAQIAAQSADLLRGSTVECFGYVAKKNANTVARATAQAEAICAEALKINPSLKKVITVEVDPIMALQPNRIRVFG
jgi:uncharacterized repeat protein (TIGR02543 family)